MCAPSMFINHKLAEELFALWYERQKGHPYLKDVPKSCLFFMFVDIAGIYSAGDEKRHERTIEYMCGSPFLV